MRRKVDSKDLGEVECKPASNGTDKMGIWPSSVLGKRGGGVTQIGGRGDTIELSGGSPDAVVGGNGDSKVSSPSP